MLRSHLHYQWPRYVHLRLVYPSCAYSAVDAGGSHCAEGSQVGASVGFELGRPTLGVLGATAMLLDAAFDQGERTMSVFEL